MLARPLARISLGRASTISSCNVIYTQKRNNSYQSTFGHFINYASDSYITQGVQTTMEVIHSTGLPWGFTFIASGLVLRLVSAPAHVYAEKIFAKRLRATSFIQQKILEKAAAQFHLKVVPNEEMTKLTLSTNNEKILAKVEELTKENTIEIISSMNLGALRIQCLKFFTIPVWMFSSFAIRNIVGGDFSTPVPGTLWFPDLLSPDPYFALPVLVGILGFVNLYHQRFIYPVNARTWSMKGYDFLLSLMTIIAVRILMEMPACFPLYWLSVSITGIAQSMIIRHPRFKALFGIPKLPTDSKTPFRDLLLMRRPQV